MEVGATGALEQKLPAEAAAHLVERRRGRPQDLHPALELPLERAQAAGRALRPLLRSRGARAGEVQRREVGEGRIAQLRPGAELFRAETGVVV